jgi:nucleotide-binding universal stress UspA family protein
VLVAVDDSQTSDKVFDAAAALAKLSGGRLLIIHVISTPAGISVGPLLYGGGPDMGDLAKELERRGRALLEEYTTRAAKEFKIEAASSPSSVETILVQGPTPADAIIKEAESRSADLIVVGSKGFGGAKGFLLGSVPNSVLHHSRIPVPLVKP